MIHDYDLSVILPRLTGPLREILDAELSVGNTMVEISSGWPMPNVNVLPKNPLNRKYVSNYPDLERCRCSASRHARPAARASSRVGKVALGPLVMCS